MAAGALLGVTGRGRDCWCDAMPSPPHSGDLSPAAPAGASLWANTASGALTDWDAHLPAHVEGGFDPLGSLSQP